MRQWATQSLWPTAPSGTVRTARSRDRCPAAERPYVGRPIQQPFSHNGRRTPHAPQFLDTTARGARSLGSPGRRRRAAAHQRIRSPDAHACHRPNHDEFPPRQLGRRRQRLRWRRQRRQRRQRRRQRLRSIAQAAGATAPPAGARASPPPCVPQGRSRPTDWLSKIAEPARCKSPGSQLGATARAAPLPRSGAVCGPSDGDQQRPPTTNDDRKRAARRRGAKGSRTLPDTAFNTSASEAFERGVEALAQYKARTGSVKVPRAHVERLEDGTEIRLGVFLSNSKSRRGKLSADKLAALAILGMEWAAAA